MPRFIKEADYAGLIKPEIKKQLTGTTGTEASLAQARAEDTAIATIRQKIGHRYNCDIIFTPAPLTGADTRDLYIVHIVIALALYDLYSQTGTKDLPEHRHTQYEDAMTWLKEVGRGDRAASLPPLLDGDGDTLPVDIRFNSRPLRPTKW